MRRLGADRVGYPLLDLKSSARVGEGGLEARDLFGKFAPGIVRTGFLRRRQCL
jgi:hypothetical protein